MKNAHPLVGSLVAGYFDDGYRLALVEKIVFPRKKPGGSLAPFVVVRLHGGEESLSEGKTFVGILSRYAGTRVRVPVTSIRSVLPGEGEGWIDGAEFLDWAEADR